MIRDTQAGTAGSEYRLWTTLKVPQGYDAQKHCRWLGKTIGAEDYQWLPTLRVFALGVGHVAQGWFGSGSDE
ncbi:MAG: hypothetical protein HC898_02765 [Phycisphaerales bacterium]|nr:hypothetical protein [Phycisphaerales bacterium]